VKTASRISPAIVLAVLLLFLVGCARSDDIAQVRAYHLSKFPRASIGKLMDRLFAHPRWSETTGPNGSAEVVVRGEMPIEVRLSLSPDRSTILSMSLLVNGTEQTELSMEEFLTNIYEMVYPETLALLGRWVNREDFERMLYFRPDGTFHMHAWPWDCEGSYEVIDDTGKIILRPDPPLDPSAPTTELAYSVGDDNHIFVSDPDSDILLVSHPLEFRRE